MSSSPFWIAAGHRVQRGHWPPARPGGAVVAPQAAKYTLTPGTPVVVDNRRRPLGDFTTAGPSGRVSIYAATNGAAFLPAAILDDEEFGRTLATLRDALDLTEVHLTGGEPTLHPAVARLTRIAVDAGFRVGMTSNGERGERVLPECVAAGLDRVNFSIFGTTAAELAEVQDARYRNPERAERKIDALKRSIATCETHGIKASANIVVLDHSHAPRVHRLLDEYSPHLSVRLPDGRRVFFKQIRPVRLPETCAGCRFNNDTDCQEGFYGVRPYYDRTGRYQVGVCIQRMDLCLPLDEFLTSPLRAEILALREAEYQRLATRQAG